MTQRAMTTSTRVKPPSRRLHRVWVMPALLLSISYKYRILPIIRVEYGNVLCPAGRSGSRDIICKEIPRRGNVMAGPDTAIQQGQSHFPPTAWSLLAHLRDPK